MKYLKRQVLLWFCCGCFLCSAAQVVDTAHPIIKYIPADTTVAPDSAVVFIADVSVHGNKKTKPYIIEREMPFKQGEYIRKDDLKRKLLLARNQIMNTSLFTDVFVYVESEQAGLVFINVDVKERWYIFPLPYFKIVDRNFNQWWVTEKHSFERVNYGIKYMQNNVTGRNDKLNIWLIGGYTQQITLRYDDPFIDKGLKNGFDVGFNFARQRELNYATGGNKQLFYKEENSFIKKQFHFDGTYFYRPAIKTRYFARFAYTDDDFADTVLKLNPQFLFNNKTRATYVEVAAGIQYTGVDLVAYPTKGLMGDISFVQRGFSNDMHMSQLQYHASYTLPVFRKTFLNLQSGGILRVPFNQPFYNQQLFGYGDMFLRGMEYYVVDGVAGIIGRGTLRREVLSFKVRTPDYKDKKGVAIPFSFFLKIYGDIGYAHSPNTDASNFFNDKFLHTYGAGVDIVSFYDVVFRFEYSINQLKETGLFFHVRADF
jgi:outer membrane protein assembly factor BamA